MQAARALDKNNSGRQAALDVLNDKFGISVREWDVTAWRISQYLKGCEYLLFEEGAQEKVAVLRKLLENVKVRTEKSIEDAVSKFTGDGAQGSPAT